MTLPKFSPESLVVSEVFRSIQGEGPSIGRPASFLRLGYCNLHCSWCDTGYAWDAKRFDLQGELRKESVASLAEQLQAGPQTIIVTGGEPLLQQSALAGLIAALPEKRFEVETAGTLAPTAALAESVEQWNVSPKLSSSGNAAAKALRLDVLAKFAGLGAGFKFVVEGEACIDEVLALQSALTLDGARIWLMPRAATPEELDERSPWLVERCVQLGFSFGTRLHLILWGARRGV